MSDNRRARVSAALAKANARTGLLDATIALGDARARPAWRERLAIRVLGLATFALPAGHPAIGVIHYAAGCVEDPRRIGMAVRTYDD